MGSGNSATQAAANANAQSQAQIQNAVTGINAAYNSPARAQQIQTYGGNLQNYYDTQVNQQQAINARDLTFSNARSGLTGGGGQQLAAPEGLHDGIGQCVAERASWTVCAGECGCKFEESTYRARRAGRHYRAARDADRIGAERGARSGQQLRQRQRDQQYVCWHRRHRQQ